MKRAQNAQDGEATSQPFEGDMDAEFGQAAAESQLYEIGTSAYQERADLEVEGLNDWERQHLGGQDTDSDEDGQPGM